MGVGGGGGGGFRRFTVTINKTNTIHGPYLAGMSPALSRRQREMPVSLSSTSKSRTLSGPRDGLVNLHTHHDDRKTAHRNGEKRTSPRRFTSEPD